MEVLVHGGILYTVHVYDSIVYALHCEAGKCAANMHDTTMKVISQVL